MEPSCRSHRVSHGQSTASKTHNRVSPGSYTGRNDPVSLNKAKYEFHHLVCLWIMDPHTPQHSSKEDYEPWKWDATASYCVSHTKTMLPTRKSVPRSSRQSDHTETSWPPQRDANCSGMVMSPVHPVWPKPSCKAQWKGEEDKADRGRGGKITSGNGQAWSLPSPRGQWRTGKNGGNWLQNHLWCPNNPRGQGIDDNDDKNVAIYRRTLIKSLCITYIVHR